MLKIAFGLGLGLSFCLVAVSTGPAHSASVERLRVAQSGGDFYRRVTSNCVDAISESAMRQGVEIEVIDSYDSDFQTKQDATADIFILPDVTNLAAQRPDGFQILSDAAVFA